MHEVGAEDYALPRRYALVRVELIGEPVITPEGQTLQLVRFPWQRPNDASVGVGLEDIVACPQKRHR